MKNKTSANTSAPKKSAKKSGPLLKHTLFSTRPKAGKYQLNPLTGGRMAVLEEQGNPLAKNLSEGDEVDPFTVYEAFFVAILDGEELAELSLLEKDEWKLKVRTWSMGVDDDEINAFWDVFNGELAAAKEAQTKVRKKPRKRVALGG